MAQQAKHGGLIGQEPDASLSESQRSSAAVAPTTAAGSSGIASLQKIQSGICNPGTATPVLMPITLSMTLELSVSVRMAFITPALMTHTAARMDIVWGGGVPLPEPPSPMTK